MIIKSFTAESIAEALKRVRTEMGGDAFVLKTRKFLNVSGLENVEVTACAEEKLAQRSPSKSNGAGATNRIEKAVSESTCKQNIEKPVIGKSELETIHDRLDAIEGMLAALISQTAEKHSN